MKIRLKKIATKFRQYLINHPKFRYEYFGKNLNCACAIASEALVRHLRNHGYNAKFIVGIFDQKNWVSYTTNHCWVEACGFVIDLTATQFGIKDEVFILPIKNDRYVPVEKGRAAIKYVKTYWPLDQHPLGIKVNAGLKAVNKALDSLTSENTELC